MMASSKTCLFFEQGTHAQFEYVLSKYQEVMTAKANAKSSKPETLLKLDKWYQTELPKKIKSRGKEPFLTHDEIVQCIKWKLARGQFRPRLKDLVQMNTPRVVMQETKKAFRNLFKKNDIESAVQALSNLKGVGPAMASAVLAAGAPHLAPFMADECLLSLPEIEGIDYTLKEYLRLVEKTNECVERLNSEGGNWTPHDVELTIWTHYVARDLMPDLLEEMPKPGGHSSSTIPKQDVVAVSTPAINATDNTNGVNGVHSETSTDKSSEVFVNNEQTQNSSNSCEEVDKASSNVESSSLACPEADTEAKGEETVEPADPEINSTDPKADNSTVEDKNEESLDPPQLNGDAQEHKENGVENNSEESNSSTTKEENCNGDATKRPLETEEELSEAKRLKEDTSTPSVPTPIQAN